MEECITGIICSVYHCCSSSFIHTSCHLPKSQECSALTVLDLADSKGPSCPLWLPFIGRSDAPGGQLDLQGGTSFLSINCWARSMSRQHHCRIVTMEEPDIQVVSLRLIKTAADIVNHNPLIDPTFVHVILWRVASFARPPICVDHGRPSICPDLFTGRAGQLS